VSQLAKQAGNPFLVCNPEPLQMNTAFSKAYILDDAGSKAGLQGSSIFVDQSFLDVIEELCTSTSHYRVTKRQNEADFLFAVEYVNPPPDRPWCLGMLLDRQPGSVRLHALSSSVYRLKKFFPNDENPEEFCFDLESRQ